MDFLIYSLMLMSVHYISADNTETNVMTTLPTTQGPSSTAATSQKTTLQSHVAISTEKEKEHIEATLTPLVSTKGHTSGTSSSSPTEAQQTGTANTLMAFHSTASSPRSITSPGSQNTPHPSTSSLNPQLSEATTPTLSNSLKDSLLKPSPTPTTQPGSSLTMLAFGVMGFILILIVIMVILVTAVNMKGWCNNDEEKGKKSLESVINDSNFTTNGEKESITLVSVRTLNTETDTDSPHLSSVHSTILDNEEL
ncbi:endothelial cell-specific chemotaxis regulator [Sardina pilchardus]|uniref:endothelial cell-specific chemotaxis regulator n=1 Tax=Sardina pilchardus TaxID=27697 RepID=UPI002E15DC78